MYRTPADAHAVVQAQRSFLRAQNVRTLHAIHTASLRDPEPVCRECGQVKQETPRVGRSEGLTAHSVCDTEARAADGQYSTGP